MDRKTKTTQLLFLRIVAILLHAVINFIVVSYLTDFDISGSWLLFFVFLLAMILLSILFFMHLFSFIRFIKNN